MCVRAISVAVLICLAWCSPAPAQAPQSNAGIWGSIDHAPVPQTVRQAEVAADVRPGSALLRVEATELRDDGAWLLAHERANSAALARAQARLTGAARGQDGAPPF